MTCSTPGVLPSRMLVIKAQLSAGERLRARVTDPEAFARGITTPVGETPVMLGRSVQLPKEFLFRPQVQHEREPNANEVLYLQALEITSTCGIMMATDYNHNMYGCVVFLNPDMRVRDKDQEPFGGLPNSTSIVFEEHIPVQVCLEVRPPPWSPQQS